MDSDTAKTRGEAGALAVSARELKRMLHDGGEIAVLDVREEGVFAKQPPVAALA